jgi:CRP/FNR family cyclic AMP-dependent transcriptional regulator
MAPNTHRETELREFLAQALACSVEIADAVARRAALRTHPSREVIIRQGDDVSEAFLLWLGRARAVAYAREGQLVLLQEFVPGDLFGALASSGDPASVADVVAVDDSRTAAFPASDFLALAEQHSCVGLALARSLTRQLRAATERMVARTTLSAAGRIHAELLRLADLADGRTVSPAPVLAALAQRVQTTRETASRTVSALERRGIVRREGEALVIVARTRLEDLVV